MTDLAPISGLIGVYDADSTLRGEISYWLGARIGRAHCSLCDITHGLFLQRSEWREWRGGLAVPFEMFHRDDAPADVAEALDATPAVLARSGAGLVVVMGRELLDRCSGDLEQFRFALSCRLDEMGFDMPRL